MRPFLATHSPVLQARIGTGRAPVCRSPASGAHTEADERPDRVRIGSSTQAAVDNNSLASEVARPDYSDTGVGDVIGQGRPMEGCCRRNQLTLCLPSLGPGRVDQSRCNGVHADLLHLRTWPEGL